MRWTALAETGELAIVDGSRVTFHSEYVDDVPDAGLADPYAPVYAVSQHLGVLLYRGHQDDSVRVMASDGRTLTLAGPKGCEGKWPLGIAVEQPGVFRLAWIKGGTGLMVLSQAVLKASDWTLTSLPDERIPASLCLLRLDPFGVYDLESYREPNGVLHVERNGVTVPLGYPHRVGNRVVGSDMRPGAPNQLILAEPDGFYVVTVGDPSVQFPARLDENGNVSCFEGQYFSNVDIRQRPFVASPPVPVPPPVPIPVPEPPPAAPPEPLPPQPPTIPVPPEVPAPPEPAPPTGPPTPPQAPPDDDEDDVLEQVAKRIAESPEVRAAFRVLLKRLFRKLAQ